MLLKKVPLGRSDSAAPVGIARHCTTWQNWEQAETDHLTKNKLNPKQVEGEK
jgi:hypothetical protein